MYDVMYIESLGKPSAAFIYEHFFNDAMSAASSRGMPGIRVIPEMIVSESTVRTDIEKAIELAADGMIDAFTRPLNAREASPVSTEPENPPHLVFKGSLNEVNRFFYQRGWTDGLPIIPPTEDAVAEMMTGTDLPPDHLIATLEPRHGKATIEKIAVNAVMAGCLPVHLPFVIAGVEALADNAGSSMMAASTGSFSPFWLINGPSASEANVRSSYGAASPGDIANASIGRALGLITKNIRGVRKQIEDMGVLGNPGKYTWTVAENEEFSPWTPFHVQQGLRPKDNAITLCFPQSFQQMIPLGTSAEDLLTTVVSNIAPARQGSFYIVLPPTSARTLADKGWTKQQIVEYVVEHAVLPPDYYRHYGLEEKGYDPGMGMAQETFRIFTPGPMDKQMVYVFVWGGFGSWMAFMQGGPPPVTKKVTLPGGWNSLVKRYRNVVPNYLRY